MCVRDFKKLLGFSERWFELALLTEAELLALGREYQTSDDQNSEHYRYRVFRVFLGSHRPLPAPLAEALYELGESDPNAAMGGAMRRAILELPECPATVMDKALASGERHQIKVVKRKRLLAELDAALTGETFARCLESHDGDVQRELLAHPEITRPQLERLAQDGANRAVRNMARQRARGAGAPRR